jgi:hypothetical protein
MGLRGLVSALATIFVALLASGLIFSIRNISTSKATGLSAIAGGLTPILFTPFFWIFAILFFFLFLAASRLGSRVLRVFFFWVPATAISTLGIAIFALMAFARIRFRVR